MLATLYPVRNRHLHSFLHKGAMQGCIQTLPAHNSAIWFLHSILHEGAMQGCIQTLPALNSAIWFLLHKGAMQGCIQTLPAHISAIWFLLHKVLCKDVSKHFQLTSVQSGPSIIPSQRCCYARMYPNTSRIFVKWAINQGHSKHRDRGGARSQDNSTYLRLSC